MKRLAAGILLLFASFSVFATEWQIGFDLSHAPSPVAGYFPFPVSDIINISTMFGTYQSSYFRVGFGPSFYDNYYFLIPNKEAAFSWFTGVEVETRVPGSLTWRDVQPAPADAAAAFYQPYTRIYLEQILLGDRYHRNGSLGIALIHNTRFLLPVDASTGIEPFFLHSPSLNLNLRVIDDAFWSPEGLLVSASATVEMGHSLDAQNFWAFLGFNASLDARVPIAAEQLYLQLEAGGSVPPYDFLPERIIPNFAYPSYDSRYNWNAQLNVKSRVLVVDPFFRVAFEPVIFGSFEFSGDSLVVSSFDALNFNLGTLIEMKLFHADLVEISIRAGISYDWNSKGFGMVLRVN